MLLYKKKYSPEKRDEQENRERVRRTAREVSLLRAELSSSAQKIEELESALKKTENTESGKSTQSEETVGRPIKRRRLKHLQEWSIEDWDQLLEFDREYGIFSPMDKQRIGNIYSKLEMGLTVKMSILSEGEQCLRKAINNGYKLYTLEEERWKELLTAATEEKVLPQWDLEFLEELSGKLMEGEISSKFDMVRGKDLLNVLEEKLNER